MNITERRKGKVSIVLLKRKNQEEPEHNTGTDRYLITYADLITLLLGLFVILYASSQVDQEKFKEVSEAFSDYFKTGSGVLEGGEGVLPGQNGILPEPILPTQRADRSMEEIAEETRERLGQYVQRGDIGVNLTGEKLTLTLPEKLLFQSAKAEIEPGGIKVLDTVANILSGLRKQITIDGHTDADPIRTFRYESNWHLSVSRATNVAYKLILRGVPESNMSIRGYGSQRPVEENSTAAGKAKNRRVEITISELSPDVPGTEGYSTKEDSARN